MQLSELLCYALLTFIKYLISCEVQNPHWARVMNLGPKLSPLQITVTATCVLGESTKHWGLNISKKVRKRDTAVLVDSYPTGKGIIKQPRFIYSKIRKHRRGKPGPKHATPTSRYASMKHRQKPGKYRTQNTQATTTKRYKKRTMKHNYGRSRRPFSAHSSSRPKQYSKPMTDPVGFAEPPPYYEDINVQKPGGNHLFKIMSTEMKYDDPPVDSYRAPLQQLPSEDTNTYSKPPKAPNLHIFDEAENNFGYEHDQWRNSRAKPTENYVEHTRPYTAFANPATKHSLKTEDLRDSDYDHQNHEVSAISYSDIYNYSKHQNLLPYEVHQERSKQPTRFRTNYNKVVVGGQYAEPPARYVPELHAVPTVFIAGASPNKESLPSVSSYINYKYGNMAFSPQNLNDAFGTVK